MKREYFTPLDYGIVEDLYQTLSRSSFIRVI
jgi:hypothetical protein